MIDRTQSRLEVRRSALFAVIIVFSLASPLSVIAQEAGTPVPDVPVVVPAGIVEAPPIEPEIIEEPAPEPLPGSGDGSHELVTPIESGAPTDSSGTVVAPPTVNTDSVQLNGALALAIESGDTATISLTYAVTTPRQGTTIHAELVDEAGNTAEGWALDAPEVVNTSSLASGSAFAADFAVTAPEFVEVAHTVSLRIWSEASTDAGDEAAIASQDIVTIAVAATPAEPTIACETGDGEAITCILDADRADVTGGTLTISGTDGWTYTVNGTFMPGSGVLDLDAVMTARAFAGTVTLVPEFRDSCFVLAPDATATISVDYAYAHVADARAETSLGLATPEPAPVAPGVSIAPLHFGVFTWDGTSWGSSMAETTVTVTREGCGDLGAYDVQIQLIGDTPGFNPVLTGGSSANADIEMVETNSDPNAAPITVARTTSGFSGTAEITLEFQLIPGNEITVGTQHKEISVTTINAP